jgi:hypothetical protein
MKNMISLDNLLIDANSIESIEKVRKDNVGRRGDATYYELTTITGNKHLLSDDPHVNTSAQYYDKHIKPHLK